MNIDATNLSQFFYNYVFVIGGVATALWIFFKVGVHKAVEDHMKEIRADLAPLADLDKRLMRIEYALYNEGKTGLINKVDLLVENQQSIKDDVLILKHINEPKVRKSRVAKS